MKRLETQIAKHKILQFFPTEKFRYSFCCFCFLTLIFVFSSAVQAQVEEPPADVAPPPVRIIPKDEKKLLDAESDLKKRTQLSLKLLEDHLAKAEQLGGQNEFQKSISELGNYRAILANALDFLNQHDNGGNKVDNNYKRLEIGLRRIVPRLEILRREMPYSYGYYVRQLQKFVREARSKALEPLFDDNIVPQQKP